MEFLNWLNSAVASGGEDSRSLSYTLVVANVLGFAGRGIIATAFHRKDRASYLKYDIAGGTLVAAHWILLASASLAAYTILNCLLSAASLCLSEGRKREWILGALVGAPLVAAVTLGRDVLEIGLGFVFAFIAFAKSRRSHRAVLLLQLPMGILLAILSVQTASYSSLFFLGVSAIGLFRTLTAREGATASSAVKD